MATVSKRGQPRMGNGEARDFSGGPNLRDTPPELAQNELEDAYNITLDERGGASSRLGYVKRNGTAFSGGLVINEFWSPILSNWITQAGPSLYLGDTNTARKTFTTSALVTFAELNSLVIANHPVDGLFTSPDGITWTLVVDADFPSGKSTCIATWQNKLWVGCTDGSVHWSAAGDATAWASTDFNKLWEKDQTGIVALHIGSGQDIIGKPGLLAFKQESTYRINDSSSGSYATIDATVGAAGPKAVIGVGPKVIALSKRGIYWWREDQAGMVNASDRYQPLWRPDQINFAQQTLWCAGRKKNRAVFSLTRAASSANDLALEYHPDQGWIVAGSNAVSCYATSTGSTEAVSGGSPTVSGQVYTLDSGGTDDGVAISGRVQTRWFEPNGGYNASVWQLRVHGRGSGVMTIFKDYEEDGTDRPFNLEAGQNHWDEVYYDEFFWSTNSFQRTQPVYSIGKCRQFSLRFAFTTSTVVAAPLLLGAGTAPQVGAFSLAGLEWIFMPLGLS